MGVAGAVVMANSSVNRPLRESSPSISNIFLGPPCATAIEPPLPWLPIRMKRDACRPYSCNDGGTVTHLLVSWLV